MLQERVAFALAQIRLHPVPIPGFSSSPLALQVEHPRLPERISLQVIPSQEDSVRDTISNLQGVQVDEIFQQIRHHSSQK